jgi:Tfp pilus assembly protein PilO
VDEFMRLVQGAAAASGVQIRRITSETVVPRDYHYELPFTIDVDGPYYNIEDFFSRLSRLSRIINVGDLTFNGTADGKNSKFPLRPGTSVSGTCRIVTFFTKSDSPAAAPAPKNAAAH